MRPLPRRAGLGLLALALALACDRSPSAAAEAPHGAPAPTSPAAPSEPAPAEPDAPAEPAPIEPADQAAAVDPGYDAYAGIGYVEVVTGAADPSAPLPMIIAIHGLGDRPESFAGLLRGLRAPARVILPAGLDPSGDGFSWFPIRARSRDIDGLATGIAAASDRLATFVETIARERPTLGKPVVTGFSQGGMLSFALAVRRPDLIAAAYPVGGWLPPPLWPEGQAPDDAPPIVALHGAADTVVALRPTQDAVARLRELGYRVELREYPEVAHQISPEMRRALWALLAEASGAAAGPAPAVQALAAAPAPAQAAAPAP
ncbi:MAG: alpha/beta fold hydrolase [Myxococcales bacterium]|nr:alpha/beta fold hydrolase [Myxococcales bacterium]